MTPRKKMLDQDKKNVPDQGGVEAAMRALPLWLPDDVCDAYIPALAEKYVYMGFDGLHAPTPLTPNQIKSELSQTEKESRALFERLMRWPWQIIEEFNSCMFPTARRSGSRTPTLGEIGRSLELLSAFCAKAMVPNSAKLHNGRDQKLIPRKVAKAAACDFHSLTGKEPSYSTKRDGFPDFLSAVFKALNMDDSVENFARKASEWWHKERPNEVKESLRETMLKPTRVSEEGFIFSKTFGWHK